MATWLETLTTAISQRRPVTLVTVVAGPLAGQHLVAGPGGALLAADPGAAALATDPGLAFLSITEPDSDIRKTISIGTHRLYIETFLPPPELVIIGAGHVAQPVAQLGKLMGYTVTIIDDRPDYANATRFPTADRIICEGFVPAVRSLVVGPSTYVVLVTRGHRHDMACLLELITTSARYIGMIGSRIRVETVFRLLTAEHGIDPTHFEKVHAPIGLDLNARTPQEIAVAIAAELLKVRRGGTGESLSRLGRGRIHGRGGS
ncbi:MAG: hypothetical protein K0R39_4932 [Symbiobacteriaceae bacterium]|jgi:xanthine dehydrogenase accessory factor|nr:hypothetical protein [Symbiobacteriaceae bacterium]